MLVVQTLLLTASPPDFESTPSPFSGRYHRIYACARRPESTSATFGALYSTISRDQHDRLIATFDVYHIFYRNIPRPTWPLYRNSRRIIQSTKNIPPPTWLIFFCQCWGYLHSIRVMMGMSILFTIRGCSYFFSLLELIEVLLCL